MRSSRVINSSRNRRLPPSFSYRARVASANSDQRMSNSVWVICRPLTRTSTGSSGGGAQLASRITLPAMRPPNSSEWRRYVGVKTADRGCFIQTHRIIEEFLRRLRCLGITDVEALQGCSEFPKDGRPVLMRQLEFERKRREKPETCLVPIHQTLNP